MNIERTIHIIFKTHLDVGFTDLAGRVVAKYFDEYIPQACETARKLRDRGLPERFVWTTGAWLILEYLEQASPAKRKVLEEAIEAGDIVWHGLPFTTHSELMDAALFRYGLSLSHKLDRRFGRHTIAAKMTDVPGHTRAIVPLLAEAGIKFLHIGVNAASTAPDVPPVFVWRDKGGAEVIVMYQPTYGELFVMPGMSHAITFGHTFDNLGPQPPEEIIQIFQGLRHQFPEAKLIASDLNAYARELLRAKAQLPVVTKEIGDTWIHGAATDPKKIGQFRALCRLRSRWIARERVKPEDPVLDRYSRNLLLVAEHTWGLDEKTHLNDYVNYRPDQLAQVRRQMNFQTLEASWAEQRSYLQQAVESLSQQILADEAQQELQQALPRLPQQEGFEPVSDLARKFNTEHFIVSFDAISGAISYLKDKRTGRLWASKDSLLALFRYQTFSQADYDRFLDQYLVTQPEWSLLDFSKPGIDAAGAESNWWTARLVEVATREDEAAHHFILRLALPQVCALQYGGPKIITLELTLPRSKPSLHLDLQWFQKPANRLPEAFWLSFRPAVNNPEGWMMEKLGELFSPLEVVRHGNRKLHAIGRQVLYSDKQDVLSIETLDAPLVAPGEPSLLRFDNRQPPLSQGMHFNLYNNIWGTNFPMWYDEDARFRFILMLRPQSESAGFPDVHS